MGDSKLYAITEKHALNESADVIMVIIPLYCNVHYFEYQAAIELLFPGDNNDNVMLLSADIFGNKGTRKTINIG